MSSVSSGEAELVGTGAGWAQHLGRQSLAADMGWQLKPKFHSDANVAFGIAKRRGLGKTRHLHSTDGRIRERVRNDDLMLHTVLGADDPTDICPKYVETTLFRNYVLDLVRHPCFNISAAIQPCRSPSARQPRHRW